MGKENKTIKINGQSYDTSTGEAISVTVKTAKKITVTSESKAAPKTKASKAKSTTKSKTKVAPKEVAKPAVVVPPRPAGAPKPVMDVSRGPAQHAKAHQPQSGKTLMRHAVKKPAGAPKSAVKSKSKPTHSTPIVIADTTVSLNPAKLKDAQAVPKSQLITHFASTNIVPVANHPHAVKPVKPAAVIDIKPRPVVLPEDKPLIPSADIFQNALKQATAHEQPKHKAKKTKKRGVRGFRFATSSMAVLLLAGFIGFQNMAQINIRLAAKKAGFAATLPSYHPSGFSVGAFHYSPGVVNVSYHSNSDSRSFAVTEKPTQWDDQTLREKYVASNAGDSYEVVQTAGRIIYVYGQKNATWVDNGIWYNVKTEGSLSSHQLIQLAASI